MEDQAERLRQLAAGQKVPRPARERGGQAPPGKGARVIAVSSGKGGVGKTNLTVNLAIALQQLGQRVLVIDADLGMANVDVLLGTRAQYSLLDLLQPGVSLDDVLVEGPYGITYIPGGSALEQIVDILPAQRGLLVQKLALCGQLADVILIDTGAGLGRSVMDFILAADEVLLVTTPEPTALTDAYAVMKAYSVYAPDGNMQLIINRVYDAEESSEVAAKLAQTARRFLHIDIGCLGYVFDDHAVRQAVRHQRPFMAAAPKAMASTCVRALADKLLYGREMKVKRGWRGFLQQFFNFSR